MAKESFTLAELDSLIKGSTIICPFCGQMSFRHVGQISMGMDDESQEYRCSNCGFGGLDDNLLTHGSKFSQADNYRRELERKVQEFKTGLAATKSRLMKSQI